MRQLRRARLDAPYLNRPFEDVLRQLRIVRDVDGVMRPALIGLLMFGLLAGISAVLVTFATILYAHHHPFPRARETYG